MDLIIERYKQTSDFTLSRLYEPCGKKLFVLDVIEPPISGLAPLKSEKIAFNPGFYRLFLKGDKENCDLVTCFRKVYRRPRFGFVKVESSLPAECADFTFRNRFINAPLWIGKYCSETNALLPDPDGYNKFIIRLIIAKQHAEIINVQVK